MGMDTVFRTRVWATWWRASRNSSPDRARHTPSDANLRFEAHPERCSDHGDIVPPADGPRVRSHAPRDAEEYFERGRPTRAASMPGAQHRHHLASTSLPADCCTFRSDPSSFSTAPPPRSSARPSRPEPGTRRCRCHGGGGTRRVPTPQGGIARRMPRPVRISPGFRRGGGVSAHAAMGPPEYALVIPAGDVSPGQARVDHAPSPARPFLGPRTIPHPDVLLRRQSEMDGSRLRRAAEKLLVNRLKQRALREVADRRLAREKRVRGGDVGVETAASDDEVVAIEEGDVGEGGAAAGAPGNRSDREPRRADDEPGTDDPSAPSGKPAKTSPPPEEADTWSEHDSVSSGDDDQLDIPDVRTQMAHVGPLSVVRVCASVCVWVCMYVCVYILVCVHISMCVCARALVYKYR